MPSSRPGSLTVVLLALVGLTNDFRFALALLVVWAMIFALEAPMRQAYINGLIPSEQRATVLSFDNLMGSVGGVVAQPALGRVADVNGYGASYVVGGWSPGAGDAVHVPGAARTGDLGPDHRRAGPRPDTHAGRADKLIGERDRGPAASAAPRVGGWPPPSRSAAPGDIWLNQGGGLPGSASGASPEATDRRHAWGSSESMTAVPGVADGPGTEPPGRDMAWIPGGTFRDGL